jgi:hypothetical protein
MTDEIKEFALANKIVREHIEMAAKECEKQKIGLNTFLCELTAVTVRMVFKIFDNPELASKAITAFIDQEIQAFKNGK